MSRDEIIQAFRDYLRDHPEVNDLLRETESTDTQLGAALDMFVSRFNAWPPLSKYTLEQLYAKIGPILFEAALPHLLRSVAMLLVRNDATIPGSPPISNNEQQRIQVYLNLAAQLEASMRQELAALKQSLNVEAAFDIIDGDELLPGLRWMEGDTFMGTNIKVGEDDV